jgi:hypothetical protein
MSGECAVHCGHQLVCDSEKVIRPARQTRQPHSTLRLIEHVARMSRDNTRLGYDWRIAHDYGAA